MTVDRISVAPPAAEASRDRVESRVFDRLDAMRAAERADARIANRHRGWPRFALAGVAVAAIVAVAIGVLRRGDDEAHPQAMSPSRVVTPAGGSSRFTIDDAVIDAGSDTSVEVQTGDGGAVTLVLARGTIDCEVAPRDGRPFSVVAGDVTVEVVGTRFTVARDPAVRVDVTHGRVRVRTPEREWAVSAGERWPAPAETAAIAPPAGSGSAEIEMPPHEMRPRDRVSPREAFLAAQRLEAHDWSAAARGYRAVAAGDDRWAALALYSLAELDASHGRPREALAELDDYRRRFPHGASAEDEAWLRVQALRALGKPDVARAAAADYLRRFPDGTYTRPAGRLAAPP